MFTIINNQMICKEYSIHICTTTRQNSSCCIRNMGLDDKVFIPYLFCLVWGFFIFIPKLSSAQRVTYVVRMGNSFKPKPFITQQEWYFSIVNSLKPANQTLSDTPVVLYTYDTALHGFSALLSPDEFKALKNISGFISAYSDKISHT
jgi:hypothetical protein